MIRGNAHAAPETPRNEGGDWAFSTAQAWAAEMFADTVVGFFRFGAWGLRFRVWG